MLKLQLLDMNIKGYMIHFVKEDLPFYV